MQAPWLLVVAVIWACTFGASATPTPKLREAAGISQALFDDLRWYFQYASSAYADSCMQPNGQVLLKMMSNGLPDTQGFIARDDTRKEIVVSLRGTAGPVDLIFDGIVLPVPLVSPGIKAPLASFAHAGFLTGYNSVANEIINTIKAQLRLYPGYSIVTAGHSLGGALASIAGLSLHQNFPNNDVRVYTYGQPRTFNSVAAKFLNAQLGSKIYRSVHTNDSVPLILPQRFLDYRHHGVEYWQHEDPAIPANFQTCAPDGEDPNCSNKVFPGSLDAHSLYYGIRSGTAFCA